MKTFESALADILEQDPRYTREAYIFAQESLDHAIELRERAQQRSRIEGTDDVPEADQHIDGAQLCEAFKDLALERYGILAPEVLSGWGLHTTRDLGNAVFNLIAARVMKANEEDRVEDFNDRFEFEVAFDAEIDLIP